LNYLNTYNSFALKLTLFIDSEPTLVSGFFTKRPLTLALLSATILRQSYETLWFQILFDFFDLYLYILAALASSKYDNLEAFSLFFISKATFSRGAFSDSSSFSKASSPTYSKKR